MEIEEGGHNQLDWAKVRKRAILQTTTMADWENASDLQRKIIHEIELALISVTDEHVDRWDKAETEFNSIQDEVRAVVEKWEDETGRRI